jgi:RNA-directed DNA polymerase
VNIVAPALSLEEASDWVLKMQIKLHQWSKADKDRRFDDLYNLVYHPTMLSVAWHRVKGNRGARTAGVDGQTARQVEDVKGEEEFLASLREELRTRSFRPLPVKERMIPKANGKLRRLGIPTLRDRVVQEALKLVLEPIFEADFRPCSYGFRPNRRAQDAIEEIVQFGNLKYEWVLEGDIEACFDEISHPALMDRMRRRVKDKRVLALVKGFLKSGLLSELGQRVETHTGTPQGGILSPLLANIALSALDDHFVQQWEELMGTDAQRSRRRQEGLGNWRLIRYADDWVVMVFGNRANAEALRPQAEQVLATIGLRLSEAKTKVVNLDEGFDFLGFHIQRRQKRGTTKRVVYTQPSKRAITKVKRRVREITRRASDRTDQALIQALNPVLRGWTNYFRHGVSKDVFAALQWFAEQRTVRWLRHRHPGKQQRPLPWREAKRRFIRATDIVLGDKLLFKPASVPVTRYRYRGANIPTPWTTVGVQL